ncbi:unnamed protein product, partial [Cyprideis torosa]
QSLEKLALTMRIAQRSRTPCVKQAAAGATQASFNRISSASNGVHYQGKLFFVSLLPMELQEPFGSTILSVMKDEKASDNHGSGETLEGHHANPLPILGETCTANEDCAAVPNALCQASICRCNTGFIQQDFQCVGILGGSCAAHTECTAEVPNSVCDAMTCKCDTFFKEKNSLCVERTVIKRVIINDVAILPNNHKI